MAEYCRCCPECQKCSTRKDIVGLLPRSRSGNQYILVICDYVMRYPEAVPLRRTDAEHVAEELVKLFSQVGVPSEILRNRGVILFPSC